MALINWQTGAKISKIVIIVAVAVILVWDIAAIFLTGAKLEASVSQAIWDFSRAAPFVPFLAGFVCGHLWWGDPQTSITWSIKNKNP